MEPTQVRHPKQATARTVIAAAIGLLPILPIIAHEFGAESIPWVAGVLTVTGTITRVMALPQVEAWLQTHFPLLAAAPPEKDKDSEDS